MLNQTWEKIDGKKLRRQFTFRTFPEAVTFVDKIVPIAEAHDHHPDIAISYNKVTIELTTHKQDGLTEKDFTLAAEIEKLV
jgi:4a-hydroxytetrahydrobiopterin dehydratase